VNKEQKEYYKGLDFILNTLNEHPFFKTKYGFSIDEMKMIQQHSKIRDYFIDKGIDYNILLDRLMHDNYIIKDEQHIYRIETKGRAFLMEGGYIKTNNWWLKNDAINLKWVIGIVIAISAVIVAIIKIKPA
jgi:hypothetical protein